MLDVCIKFECRHPNGLCNTTASEQYKVALEMIAWADQNGFHTINFCEHHGVDDGYLPSPMIMAAAAAAITKKVRLQANVVMPYHDPLRVAEDMAVVDIISEGRAEVVLLGGYVPSEFEMFNVELIDRGAAIEEGVEVLRKAWAGESFEYRGRRVRVTPKPVQPQGPPLYIGGGVAVAGRRAARIADGFVPMFPQAYEAYAEECVRLGKTSLHRGSVCSLLNIAEDPDEAWEALGPYALHETNCYARWQAETGVTGIFQESNDVNALRESGIFLVLTPTECLEMIESLGDEGYLMLHPLIAGVDANFGWQSLKLFREKVMPFMA